MSTRRTLKKNVYILSEGATERFYIEGFRKRINCREYALHNLKHNGGRSAVNLVDEAWSKFKYEGYDKKTDLAFVIFDKDDNDNASIQRAFSEAKKHGIKIIYTNECFELWFLMHYQQVTSPIDRGQFEKRLSKCMEKDYIKPAEDAYDILMSDSSRLKNAIKRAQSSRKDNAMMENPYTNMDELVEFLLELVEMSKADAS